MLNWHDLAAAPDVAPIPSGINPATHFPHACAAATRGETLRVAMIGDSIGTDRPGITHHAAMSLWGGIQEQLRLANPQVSFAFANFAWGSRTVTNLNRTIAETLANGAAPPLWPHGRGDRPWIDHAIDWQPHVLFVNFGMNDRQNLAPAQWERAMARVTGGGATSLCVITPMVPAADTANANISAPAAQNGRLFAAHYMRTWAQAGHHALIDLTRAQLKAVAKPVAVPGLDMPLLIGRDIGHTVIASEAQAVLRDWPHAGPVTDQDFGIDITLPAAAWRGRRMRLQFAAPGQHASGRIEVFGQSGVVASDIWWTGGRLPDAAVASGVGVPDGGDVTVQVWRRGARLVVTVNDADVLDRFVPGCGGAFAPQVGWADGGTEGCLVRHHTARFVPVMAQMDDAAMWGRPGPGRAVTGGNGMNHPAQAGVARVIRPALEAQDWRLRPAGALHLLVDAGGGPSLRTVHVGEPDSGGPGFRLLRVAN